MLDRKEFLSAPAIKGKPLLMFYPYAGYKIFSFSTFPQVKSYYKVLQLYGDRKEFIAAAAKVKDNEKV